MTRPRIAAIALDRPAQRPWQRTPLPPRLPREAGQLGVPGPGKQALPNAPRPPAPVHLPSLPTCLPAAPVHRCPTQPAPKNRPARRPATLVPRPSGAAQPAAALASRQAATLPNGGDRGGLAQLCLLPLNPSLLWATARNKLLVAHRIRINPAAPQV